MNELEEQIRTMGTEELVDLHQLVCEELEVRQQIVHEAMIREDE